MKNRAKTPEESLEELKASNLENMTKIAEYVFSKGTREFAEPYFRRYYLPLGLSEKRSCYLQIMDRSVVDDFSSLCENSEAFLAIKIHPEDFPGETSHFNIEQHFDGQIKTFLETVHVNWLNNHSTSTIKPGTETNKHIVYSTFLDLILLAISKREKVVSSLEE